jgi:hypothetical protein
MSNYILKYSHESAMILTFPELSKDDIFELGSTRINWFIIFKSMLDNPYFEHSVEGDFIVTFKIIRNIIDAIEIKFPEVEKISVRLERERAILILRVFANAGVTVVKSLQDVERTYIDNINDRNAEKIDDEPADKIVESLNVGIETTESKSDSEMQNEYTEAINVLSDSEKEVKQLETKTIIEILNDRNAEKIDDEPADKIVESLNVGIETTDSKNDSEMQDEYTEAINVLSDFEKEVKQLETKTIIEILNDRNAEKIDDEPADKIVESLNVGIENSCEIKSINDENESYDKMLSKLAVDERVGDMPSKALYSLIENNPNLIRDDGYEMMQIVLIKLILNITDHDIDELCAMSVDDLLVVFRGLDQKLRNGSFNFRELEFHWQAEINRLVIFDYFTPEEIMRAELNGKQKESLKICMSTREYADIGNAIMNGTFYDKS